MPGKRILVVSHSVKLPYETKGLDRTPSIAEVLVDQGHDVTLVTSRFQHWEKKHRDRSDVSSKLLPYRVRFLDEPGYRKNIDPLRIASQAVFTRNLSMFLASGHREYDAMIAGIPPNQSSAECARFAEARDIPLIVDLNDLWPEAMRMVFDVPVLSNIAYAPMERQAVSTYEKASYVVGTSDEYACYPETRYGIAVPHATIPVGIDLPRFDQDVAETSFEIVKPEDEKWVAYAGTVGASYGLRTLVEAAMYAGEICDGNVRFKIIGDGPDLSELVEYATALGAPCDFLGYRQHGEAAAWLSASDVLVNSLRTGAPQSIPSKIADYLAAGKAIVNTGSSRELERLLVDRECGVTVPAEDPIALAATIETLVTLPGVLDIMGKNGRRLAEEKFDRTKTYIGFSEIIEDICRS